MARKDGKDKALGRALKVVRGPGSGNGGSGVDADFEAVRALARIAAEFDLQEVEVDGKGHVRVRRGGGALPTPGAPAPMGSVGRPISLTSPVPSSGEAAGAFVTSPFVGTFYRAPSPESPVFVEVGQNVRKGQVVCIVEAMKLMNEIEAETEGRVDEILVKNGEHVEYGQRLLRLTPS
jgi:acetyl-CoA carboxylase biotin carboxyl carrier protein